MLISYYAVSLSSILLVERLIFISLLNKRKYMSKICEQEYKKDLVRTLVIKIAQHCFHTSAVLAAKFSSWLNRVLRAHPLPIYLDTTSAINFAAIKLALKIIFIRYSCIAPISNGNDNEDRSHNKQKTFFRCSRECNEQVFHSFLTSLVAFFF